MQSCLYLFKSGDATSNVVDIICTLWLEYIGLTELLNSGGAPAPPLTTALYVFQNISNTIIKILLTCNTGYLIAKWIK